MISKQAILHLANRHRHDFHTWRRIEWQAIWRYLDAEAGQRVLDLACGKGYYASKMASQGLTVYGLDLDPVKIDWAVTYHLDPSCYYHLGNGERLPYLDESFDRVVSVCALEHFSDPVAAMREVKRVLRPSGILALSIDSLANPYVTDGLRARHQRLYQAPTLFTRYSLCSCLEEVGLQMLESRSLFRSRIAHQLYQWGSRQGFTGFAFLVSFPVAVLLVMLGDALTSSETGGYIVVAKAIKPAT